MGCTKSSLLCTVFPAGQQRSQCGSSRKLCGQSDDSKKPESHLLKAGLKEMHAGCKCCLPRKGSMHHCQLYKQMGVRVRSGKRDCLAARQN